MKFIGGGGRNLHGVGIKLPNIASRDADAPPQLFEDMHDIHLSVTYTKFLWMATPIGCMRYLSQPISTFPNVANMYTLCMESALDCPHLL